MPMLWVLWLACLASAYGAVDTDQRCPIFTAIADFPADEGHFSDHWLLLPTGCEKHTSMLPSLESGLGPRKVAMVDDVLAEKLDLNGSDVCQRAACIDRGTPLHMLQGGLRHWNPVNSDVDSLLDWSMVNCQQAHVGFVNLDSRNYTIVWPDDETTEDKLLAAGGRNASVSFYRNDVWFSKELGARFKVLNDQGEVRLRRGSS